MSETIVSDDTRFRVGDEASAMLTAALNGGAQ
jgi:hypothetical protein